MATLRHAPVALVILDGWGSAPDGPSNAITAAEPQTFNTLWQTYPHTLLEASGSAVGLPEGICGNSEVGHLTLGAGKVVTQYLTLINQLIAQNLLCTNQDLQTDLTLLSRMDGALHLIGLVSDGGVHSQFTHLQELIRCGARAGIGKIFIHAILDGRDTPPHSAANYLTQLELFCKTKKTGVIASICGRFYAMDRDEQWERTRAAYDLYTTPPPIVEQHWQEVLRDLYNQNITDEFVPPTNLHPEGFIRPEDGIFLFNFRPDRMRQLTALLLGQELPAKRARISDPPPRPAYQFLMSMTRYHKLFTNPVILEQIDTTDTLLDRLEQKKLKIFTIAETEKYAHVTYFFSGGKEAIRVGEKRVLVPSLGTPNYADTPCMSAAIITQKILESLSSAPADFYVINYANADMVGHTGMFDATKRAVSCVDQQLKSLFKEIVLKRDGALFLVGDHGNAEEMWDNKTGALKTSHTTNPVPFIAVNAGAIPAHMHGLGDVAPVILKLFGV